jgi:hypothetical protein
MALSIFVADSFLLVLLFWYSRPLIERETLFADEYVDDT